MSKVEKTWVFDLPAWRFFLLRPGSHFGDQEARSSPAFISSDCLGRQNIACLFFCPLPFRLTSLPSFIRISLSAPAEGNTRMMGMQSLSILHAQPEIILPESKCSFMLCPACGVFLYSNGRMQEFFMFAHGAGGQPTREQMLSHPLPCTRSCTRLEGRRNLSAPYAPSAVSLSEIKCSPVLAEHAPKR